MSTAWDFTHIAGNTLVMTVTATDQDGAAFYLPGCTIDYVIQPEVTSTTATIALSTADGIVIDLTVEDGNEFTITVDAADTSGLEGGYYHEAVVTVPETPERVYTIFSGNITFIPSGV
jgi:hypothetical protein